MRSKRDTGRACWGGPVFLCAFDLIEPGHQRRFSWRRSAAWASSSRAPAFILLNPDANQLTRDIMSLGKRVQALRGNELLRDLPLELNAVGWLSSFELTLSNH